ncbi:metal ABC transporter permease [Fulvimarina sp. 2208YS6-2-32]|uniref:High-affinity zinc uptake system membrane protein ZnuB n=1 Tax=Fulvimarina uroteuthidis TaxID=3098149 RepID=A0ABU5HX41_9HYPH|nr:metal ABC transporter permease [Fulvimarina sp. 2208YS6-2-32]MDY8107600.1 metal ABC transporter permease [Fulvimarina sp. 2208YS6-2-32]
MLDDFFTRALVAGIGVALVAGPLGCFVVWRRLAYFGDTLSHAALLGVALAFLFEANVTIAVFAVSLLVALSLLALRRSGSIASDTLLGLLSHSALAIGLVALSFMASVRIDLMGYLFGDILAVSRLDILQIWLGGAAVLAVLALIWRPFFAATVSEEIASGEGLSPRRTELVFIVLMAGVVAMALKIVGALLVTALLLIPAATARRFAPNPEMMAVLAALIGALAVILGLYGSLSFDTPSGPSIVVAALILFIGSQLKFPANRNAPPPADMKDASR